MADDESAMAAEASPTAPYCRARPLRPRVAARHARLTTRHVAGRVVLAVRRTEQPPAPGPRPLHRTLIALTLGFLVLVSGLSGYLAVSGETGKRVATCPAASSMTVVTGGHTLRVRAEQPVAGTVLVHLCAGETIDPIVRWSVSEAAPAEFAVLAVTHREGLAALSAGTALDGLTVTVETTSGQVLRFLTADA